MIPLGKIQPSLTNPRQHFDRHKMMELMQSVMKVGVLQPILVRPWPKGREQPSTGAEYDETADYEIVAGERRWTAAGMAGLDEIPAVVRDLSDREVLEIQVIENEQRSDVLPSERAAGYGRLIAAGATMQEIADRIGKSLSTIRNILLLNRLPKVAQEALDNDVISRSTAELIARLPREGQRAQAAVDILKGEIWRKDEDGKPIPFSFRQAKDYIESNHQVELKNCGFDPKDKKLLPEAGSCKDCPKRMGNLQKLDPETYQGGRADVCTDPTCYQDKVNAHQRKELEKRQKEHAERSKTKEPPQEFRHTQTATKGSDVTSGTRIDPHKKVNPLPPPSPPKPSKGNIGNRARSLAMTVLADYATEQAKDLEQYDVDGESPWVEGLRLAVLGYCSFLCTEQPLELSKLSVANIRMIHAIDLETGEKITSDYKLWLNFVKQASPSQLLGFLVSASAVFTLDAWSESRDRPDPNYWKDWVNLGERLLSYAELDWPTLWDQAERELSGAKPVEQKIKELEEAEAL